jgi:hypothetical protein
VYTPIAMYGDVDRDEDILDVVRASFEMRDAARPKEYVVRWLEGVVVRVMKMLMEGPQSPYKVGMDAFAHGGRSWFVTVQSWGQ